MKVHIRRTTEAKAPHSGPINNYVTLNGNRMGTTPWPWMASDEQILEHLCPRCDAALGNELRAAMCAASTARKAAWESLPETIRRAIHTASGGNRTVIRCDVPGYSSRLSNAIHRMAEENGLTIAQIGQKLIEAGISHICGHPIPQQWANVR
jgi:hypothetical protein